MSEESGLAVTRDFERRVFRMTTGEMRRCAEEWQRKIDSGQVPEERKQAAKHQLLYLRDQIEERRKSEPHPRTLRI